MLTREQLDKLQPLVRHPKYGALLKAAITSWEKIKPSSDRMGILPKRGKFIRRDSNTCCLIGASVWKKKYLVSEDCSQEGPYFAACSREFNISSFEEFRSLIDGFDGRWQNGIRKSSDINDAFIFGMLVREIVLC